MSPIFFNNLVIVYSFSEIAIVLLALVVFVLDVRLLRYWDFNSFSNAQLRLERVAYLVMTIVTFFFALKLILLIYFVYTIDALSAIVPGAMCGAGVISADSYGMKLLFVKLLVIFALLLFLVANHYDLKAKNYPLFKFKSWVVVAASLLIFLEFFLDISYFFGIDTTIPVSCCSILFGNLEGANPLPFNLNTATLLILFFVLYTGSVLSLLLENKITTTLLVLLFGTIAYYSVVYFFGTYVYELPTHKCPFCMLQSDYYYVGYLIWSSLFFGLFFGIIWVIMALLGYNSKRIKWASIALLTLFVVVNSAYVASYYLRNGVFL